MAIPGLIPSTKWLEEEEKKCAKFSGVTLEDFKNNKLPENNADSRWKKILAKVAWSILSYKDFNRFETFPKEGSYEYYAEKLLREEYEKSPDISKELMKYRKASLKYIDDICDGKIAIKPTIGYNINWDVDFRNKLYALCFRYGGSEVERYIEFLTVLLTNKSYYENYPFVWDIFEDEVFII